MERAYDALIVGSGFGGGVTACRLAEAGWRVCVLERGRRFGRGDFPDRPEQAPRLLWHPSANPGGMFDFRLMRDVAVLQAACVGGGSVVYANVQLRAPQEVFDSGWPEAIDRSELDPWYDRTEEALDPRTTPDEPPLRKLGAFEALGRLGGTEAERLPLAVHFGEDRAHPFSGVAQGGCTNLARCNIGCPRGAKNTVDITYLARAEALGAEVYPLHEALRVERQSGGWRVGFRDLQYGAKGKVEAPVLVLAAGCLGTTRLLLKNRRRIGGLSPALGSRFSGNGDALGGAFDPRAPGLERAEMHIGPVMTSRLDYWDERRFMLADGALPEAFSGLLEIVRGGNALTGWRRHLLLRLRDLARSRRHQRPAGDAALGAAGQEPPDHRLDRVPDDRPGRGRRADAAHAALPHARHPLEPRRQPGAVRAHAPDDRGAFPAAGADPYFAIDGGPLGKYVTVHPLGGAPMADDPSRGVTDDAGRVHGHRGLVVADGSVVPTALTVNPAKTIAALAERSAAALVAEGRP